MTTSGKDAVRKRGRGPARPDDYGRSGSPIRPDKFDTVGPAKVMKGVGAGASRTIDRKFDEIDRSRVSTSASVRSDFYTDRPRSEASGGPASNKPRPAVPYDPDRKGPTT